MNDFLFNRVSAGRQYGVSILAVLVVSASCYLLSAFVDYRVVAFLLLVTVSLVAVLFDILPVLVAAFLSAIIWDLFFIPPKFTLQVDSAADGVLLLMYFVIAMVNAVLTYRIKIIQKEARKKIERENIVKLYNTFLNSLSHELKTPIATIIGAMDNLLTNTANLTPMQRHELLVEVSKASFRLDQQVGNLLSMSRLEAGFIRPKTDWVDMNELVYDVVKRVEENKVSQHISINIPPELPLFKVDKGMVEQIVYNLVNNAVQHTPPGSNINLTVTDYGWLQVVVEDNGKGFPEDERGRVFEKFYRLKRSGTGGTGLGLSIVRGFAEAMDGKILLENVTTGGARFTLSIPAERAQMKL
ncbi:MAG: PAS domain-containing sensor histidine kinase [Taibaiella sp.]|nr:PAS domain-containing sensor histidine kinase [Taibaiella sp.]